MSGHQGFGMITSRIKERFYRREPVFSFEFFPPKNDKGEEALRKSLKNLAPLAPTFVSVTYGAGGSTRERTREIVCGMEDEHSLTAMAHVTCVGHSFDDMRKLLADYAAQGISNILALRGDPPKDAENWTPAEDGPKYAVEVVDMAKKMGAFCIGVAGYPEKHPQAASMEEDLLRLKEKVDAGADFVITQLFFDNDKYFDYVTAARRIGVTVPIIPGIMPITRTDQIARFTGMTNCTIPEKLQLHLRECGDNTAKVQEIGLAYCAAQCADLLRRGAPGIHFYTLNRSRACHTVYSVLNSLGFWNP